MNKPSASMFSRIRRWVRRIWIAGGLTSMGVLAWSVQAHGVDAALLDSAAGVAVIEADAAVAFLPVSAPPGAPLLIFLPGGLVDANAYVPLARGLADRGVPIAIVELPWRSAPTERARRQLWGRIESARERWGQGRPIVVAGHSRGGALAARFVAERAQPAGTPLGGLILMGTTHPRDHDLSGVSFPVLRIVASEDCVASPSAARANATRLPPETSWVAISGGNHRQFGYYGWQIGDCAATISREEQHRQVIEAVTGFLRMAGLDSGR